MPDLTLQHIDKISQDLRKQEITISHLLEELIDHVCCDVENEMNNGADFSDAYKKVKMKIGPRRLKEIQEETLYAVDTKYRKMKNTMKLTGIAGTIMFGFAALFKIQHWAGAGILLTIGALLLAFVFMPSALGVLWKETHSRKRLFLFISSFFVAMLFIAGTLFKIQHWPGAGIVLSLAALSAILFFIPSLLVTKLNDPEKNSKRAIYILGAAGLVCYILGFLFKLMHWPMSTILLVGGLAVIFFVVFPWYTWVTWKEENNVSTRFIYMVIGSLAIVVPSIMINLNLQRNYNIGYYVQQNEQQAMFDYLYSNNQKFLKNNNDSVTSTVHAQIQVKTNNLLQVIYGVESKMIAESEGKPGSVVDISQQIKQTENGPRIQFGLLNDAFKYEQVRDYLLPGCSTRSEIDTSIKEYIDYLSGLSPEVDLHKLEQLLDPTVYLPVENSDLVRITLMSGLHSLALLKNSILVVEANALSAVSKH